MLTCSILHQSSNVSVLVSSPHSSWSSERTGCENDELTESVVLRLQPFYSWLLLPHVWPSTKLLHSRFPPRLGRAIWHCDPLVSHIFSRVSISYAFRTCRTWCARLILSHLCFYRLQHGSAKTSSSDNFVTDRALTSRPLPVTFLLRCSRIQSTFIRFRTWGAPIARNTQHTIGKCELRNPEKVQRFLLQSWRAISCTAFIFVFHSLILNRAKAYTTFKRPRICFVW